jgi:GntR family transcriptional regulator
MPEEEEEAQRGPWAKNELITAYLRYGILTGDYPPGSNLPSTRALKEQFKAAPQTIRDATMKLADERLAYSVMGRGIVVRDHRMRVMTPAAYKEPAGPGEKYRWISEAEKNGFAGRSQLLQVAEMTPEPADVREAMGLPDDGVAVLRAQILFLGDEPCELVKNYYPVEIARDTPIAQPAKIKGGAGRVLKELGFPTIRCIDEVMAIQPTPEQYEALQMPAKIPVLRTLRKTLSSDDRVIEVTEMAKAGHLYKLRYEF